MKKHADLTNLVKNKLLDPPLYEEIKKTINTFNPRMWEIAVLYFQMGRTYAYIGTLYDISKERVRQILTKFEVIIEKNFTIPLKNNIIQKNGE